jgi:hypothetical protein
LIDGTVIINLTVYFIYITANLQAVFLICDKICPANHV